MNHHSSPLHHPLFFLLLLSSAILATAQSSTGLPDAPPSPAPKGNFRPSVAVVVGIFSIMFSLTFLVLMYAKFCRSAAHELFSRDHNRRPGGLFMAPNNNNHRHNQQRSFSGIDKTVIESLPFFRFSSLKGSRDGLECAVCLSKFDDAELLRLLPKCNHAFHVGCVDRWLESHSTCPLCRYRIDPDDPSQFNCSGRFLFRRSVDDPASARRDVDELEIELFVEREPDGKMTELLTRRPNDVGNFLHKFRHRIIVSDVVFKSRWSDVDSSDLMSLNSDMLHVMSSRRFMPSLEQRPTGSADNIGINSVMKVKEEMDRKRILEAKASPSFHDSVSFDSSATPSRSLISPGNRCMSEIANVSRFHGMKSAAAVSSSAADEKVRRLWLPIARRTVQWFAGRERRSAAEFQQDNRVGSNV